MQCPSCRFENPDGMKFCGSCGAKLSPACPSCGFSNPSGFRFCGECGYNLSDSTAKEQTEPELATKSEKHVITQGERKYVTVLFSDISGYTAMSEKLDPEEVKGITSNIFAGTSQIVAKYDGFIEKFVGDAIMAMFGVPKSHEDDPVRAIMATREIHSLVEELSPSWEEKIGRRLAMHSGINTGLVVTGEVDLERGTHGVAGDTVNLAARLSSVAKDNEILVGSETYQQAEAYFDFQALEPAKVKGKAEIIKIYRLVGQRAQPVAFRRIQGLRAELVGRKVELGRLEEAALQLRQGKGAIIAISGEAGTGKSRLVEEFRKSLNIKEAQWLEGHSYAYAQNIPYFPLIDLLNRTWRIDDADPPNEVKRKIENNVERLLGGKQELIGYLGGLYAIGYPATEEVSPEFWQSLLWEAVRTVLAALTRQKPSIVCLEDLHWADPSSLDLLRFLLTGFAETCVFILVYRPPFSLFTSHQQRGLGRKYQEICLQDLSLSESQDMMESLLGTKDVPVDLKKFVQDKVEGNPFYLEEVVTSLIETGVLTTSQGDWQLSRPMEERDMPASVQGVITARLDRLEKEMRKVLQEASVIGRAFLYEILQRISQFSGQIDRHLNGLERIDLIRTRCLEPELEYIFKHALTQEAVYSSLLKAERQALHEKIGLVMESVFGDRLPEFYETLAFHFKQGSSLLKAVDYLIKSGEKSLKRYAVEESHKYFKEAFQLLLSKAEPNEEEEGLLIDLLNKWGMVYYYLGEFRDYYRLLSTHRHLAESLKDQTRLAMFYAWLGFTTWALARTRDSEEILRQAVEIGETSGNRLAVGYAKAWLTYALTDLSLFAEALSCGQEALDLASRFKSDHYLHFKALAGVGYAYFFMGEKEKTLEVGQALLEFGRQNATVRSTVMGHWICGCAHIIDGDFTSAIDSLHRAVEAAADPYYEQFPKLWLAIAHIVSDQFTGAEEVLQEALQYASSSGTEVLEAPLRMFLGVVEAARGRLGRGVKVIEEAIQFFANQGRVAQEAMGEGLLGIVYFQIASGQSGRNLALVAKNLGFLIRTMPNATGRAKTHFKRAIELSEEIGSKWLQALAYFELGRLHSARDETVEARRCFSEAANIFSKCNAESFQRQVQAELSALG